MNQRKNFWKRLRSYQLQSRTTRKIRIQMEVPAEI